MSVEDWKFTPFCPLMSGEDCSHECALDVRIDKSSRIVCALTLLAARGTDYNVNVVHAPEWRGK